MSEEVPTVLERMVRAGITDARARDYLAGGAVLVDGEQVTDQDQPAPVPSRIVLCPI